MVFNFNDLSGSSISKIEEYTPFDPDGDKSRHSIITVEKSNDGKQAYRNNMYRLNILSVSSDSIDHFQTKQVLNP